MRFPFTTLIVDKTSWHGMRRRITKIENICRKDTNKEEAKVWADCQTAWEKICGISTIVAAGGGKDEDRLSTVHVSLRGVCLEIIDTFQAIIYKQRVQAWTCELDDRAHKAEISWDWREANKCGCAWRKDGWKRPWSTFCWRKGDKALYARNATNIPYACEYISQIWALLKFNLLPLKYYNNRFSCCKIFLKHRCLQFALISPEIFLKLVSNPAA